MAVINMHAAKSQLSELVRLAQQGEDIVIARDGEPAVKLVPVKTTRAGRTFGALKGRISVPPSFFEDLPEDELAAWNK